MLKNSKDSLLTKGSDKIVDCICDYCGCSFTRRYSQIIIGREYVKKDSCKKCSIKKREETSLIKYGTRIPSQSKKVREKSSKTRGGSGKICSDYKKEILLLYNQNISINQISNQLDLGRTALIKYMKELGLDTEGDIQLKIRKTTKERYGKDYYLQTEEGQQRFKQSCLEKYGSENPFDNKECLEKTIEKRRQTSLDKHGVEWMIQHPKRQEEFTQKRKSTRIKNGQYVHEGKDVSELAKELQIGITTLYQRIGKFGLDKAISMNKYQNILEKSMGIILDSLGLEYQTQFYVNKRIADFYIPKHNLIIECDGLWWHSDAIIKNKNYHINKRQTYIDNGYIPLFFREDEINKKEKIIKGILLNKIQMVDKIYARKCIFEEVDKSYNNYIEDYHLMGIGKGRIFSLKYNGEIISLMQIKRIKDNDYEISRFCNKIGNSVVGGFSKLIKNAQDILNMESLTTFIDLRYGTGEYLKNLGFEYYSTYKSFKWVKNQQSYHRMYFPGETGYDNGFKKLWDCGHSKYIKHFT